MRIDFAKIARESQTVRDSTIDLYVSHFAQSQSYYWLMGSSPYRWSFGSCSDYAGHRRTSVEQQKEIEKLIAKENMQRCV